MDKSIVVVEESHRRSDSLASASKCFGSLVQINSIAIDLSCAMEEIESPVHEHFSIRGFVSEMRKRDQKMCLPFASEGDNDDDLVDNLPPLSVPRFRWWQCSNCVPDIAGERTPLKMLPADRSDPVTSQHVGGEQDGLFSHSIQNIGGEHCSRDSINEEDDDPSNKIIISSTRCIDGHKAITCSKEKRDVRNNGGGHSCVPIAEANPFQIRERHNNHADIAENPSIFDEPENASSGSDGAGSALPHRRKPKLRSLADIMEEENNSTSERTRTRSAFSSGMQVTSTEKEANLDPQLQLDASVDVAIGTRSPHRKRKIAFEEDRGTLETISSIDISKRLKGPILDSEKTCRIFEVSDSESGGDGSARFDLQISAKNQQTKPKRNKALDINRKMKQTHTDNRAVPTREMPKINAVHSANLQKRAVSAETSCGNNGHVPSPLRGETAPYFSSVCGKQMDRISDLSKSKRPEVEADYSPLVTPRKSILGDCHVRGKVALDLSLNSYTGAEKNSNDQTSCRHRVIPDLNESFTEKPSMAQGKQLPTLSENRSLTLHKNLDASCSKQMAREGKRQQGVSESQAVQQMHNNGEHGGTSDDIPMEIVELLAKNQHERALENSRNHFLPESINNSIRGSPAADVDGRPGTINLPLTNASSGISASSGKTGFGQGVLNFSQVKNYQLEMGNLEKSQFRLFSSFKPSQQKKTPYSGSNSVLSGPRTSEGADLLWPPRRKNQPFHVDIRHNRSVQPNGFGMHSFLDHKGKTVGDMKGNEKKALRDASKVKEGRIGSSSKSAGSLDAYSNDTIPAMQLLSLMDRGIASGSSFKLGSNSFLDKPFSPCNHHPRLNGSEKQNDPFLSSSFFSQSSHTKEFPALLNGMRVSAESLKKSYAQGQMPLEMGNTKAIHLEGPSNLVIQPSTRNLAIEICTLNRNPADFSIPEAKNEFTISAKDLKSRKRNSLKQRSRLVNVEGRKRERARKDASGKECSRK